jgi:hypothetical protein
LAASFIFCFSILILFHLLAGPMHLFLAFPEILGFWRQVDRNRYRQDRIPYIRRCHRIYYRREDVYAYKEKLEKKKNGNARNKITAKNRYFN